MDETSPEGPGKMRALAEIPGSLGPNLSGPTTLLGLLGVGVGGRLWCA